MKKKISWIFTILLMLLCLVACQSNTSTVDYQASPDSSEAATADIQNNDFKIGYLTERRGDNASNDAYFSGVQRFIDETGIEITVIEPSELQDYEVNARAFCQENYDLILVLHNSASEMMINLAQEYPNTHFYLNDTATEGIANITGRRARTNEAGFLTGAFNVLMNQELGGDAKSAFIGGMRNPALERSQYSFTSGSEYVGGECTVVYVGSFTDIAKGKEIALRLYQDGFMLMQAFAGGAGTGVYQAAESMPDGYYALGAADGQFHLSDRIIASMVVNSGDIMYQVLTDFVSGSLAPGYEEIGYADGAVSIVYAPDKEDLVPQNVKEQIKELENMLVSGEITPPNTEEEYRAFAEKHLKK